MPAKRPASMCHVASLFDVDGAGDLSKASTNLLAGLLRGRGAVITRPRVLRRGRVDRGACSVVARGAICVCGMLPYICCGWLESERTSKGGRLALKLGRASCLHPGHKGALRGLARVAGTWVNPAAPWQQLLAALRHGHLSHLHAL
jgi:hypothetical protein